MKNFEKYIDMIIKNICLDFVDSVEECKNCSFYLKNKASYPQYNQCVDCDYVKIKKWLLEEYKEIPMLSHDEYVILKNLTYGDILKRTVNGTLLAGYKGTQVPLKFDNLFGWVKNGTEYFIVDLVRNYEREQTVQEDE